MITILPYRATWPIEFQSLGGAIRQALGDLALRIDHIGSTAVPGLAAKDIIDIQLTVAKLEEPVERALNRAGYERRAHIDRDHVPPGSTLAEEEWRKWLFKPATESRPIHLHVRMAGRANQRYPLLFRDYLRAHEAVSLAYAQVKTALAQHHANDVEAYYDIKDPVCDIIVGGAEAWARRVGWEAGESDC
jgi:GrpB-like predicted nucleotidyltransferase (UPF0157 family)